MGTIGEFLVFIPFHNIAITGQREKHQNNLSYNPRPVIVVACARVITRHPIRGALVICFLLQVRWSLSLAP